MKLFSDLLMAVTALMAKDNSELRSANVAAPQPPSVNVWGCWQGRGNKFGGITIIEANNAGLTRLTRVN